MPIADAPLPSVAPPPVAAAPVPVPAPPTGAHWQTPPLPAELAPWNLPLPPREPRPDGLDPVTGRVLAGAFVTAYVLAATIEPMPDEHMPDIPLWQLPIELAAIGAVIAAAVVLWRGGRHGARLSAAAGVLMAVLTVACLLAGHSTVGWWTWVQTGLALFVIGTSAALMAGIGRQAPPAPH